MNRVCFENAKDFWNIKGDFGILDVPVQKNDDCFTAQNDFILVSSKIQKYNDGVMVRTGNIKNISENAVTITAMELKFRFNGGEYDVYSQYNGWQNESTGAWQPLVTAVSARCDNLRNCNNATPFMVLWNKQTNRGTAFHMNTYSAWEMRISRKYPLGGDMSFVSAEMGVLSEDFRLVLKPNEEIELPEVIFYTVCNKTDMDCWKLHGYLNKMYPRKTVPVIYNSWMYKFDRFTFEDILAQADKAKELGTEYFVIDAGWFGDGIKWHLNRGDWQENLSFGFKGKMKEAADYIRSCGMKFGFWLEPETASPTSKIVSEHPDWFFEGTGGMLLDFTNPDAAEHIFKKACENIDYYGAEYIKFDFNVGCSFDKDNTAFIRYFEGHTRFMKRLKERYPDLYMENCGSGGMRMSIRDGKLYDSYWQSDNQSPYFGLRIFKDTMLRMPPQWIERWATYRSLTDFRPVYASDDSCEKLLSCCDATWDLVFGVRQSFLEGFMKGGPIGLSCDLTALSDKAFSDLKAYIADFKANRSFWQNAVCHILTDTQSAVVLEFRSPDFSEAEIVALTFKTMQEKVEVYPILDAEKTYLLSDGTKKQGAEIAEEGICFDCVDCNFNGYTLHFKEGTK